MDEGTSALDSVTASIIEKNILLDKDRTLVAVLHKFNETINWIIITNDMSEFDYPNNVQRIKMSFEEVKQRIQQYFDFTIQLENYWEISWELYRKPGYSIELCGKILWTWGEKGGKIQTEFYL